MKNALSAPCVAVGALNLDICGISAAPLRMGDSNPGAVTMRAGGVAHNIARHLARAGYPVELVSVLGSDDAADLLRSACDAEHIGMRHTMRCEGASSMYLCIHDHGGALAQAINAMALLDALTPARLSACLPAFDLAKLIIVDANLPAESLAWLCGQARSPLLLDPVSGFKAERARACIGRFFAIKPNLLEARMLSGTDTPQDAARWFVVQGIRRVFISLGAEGLYYADADCGGHIAAIPMEASNTNGAGDAATAGIAKGLLEGLDTRSCARLAIESAARHLQEQGGVLL